MMRAERLRRWTAAALLAVAALMSTGCANDAQAGGLLGAMAGAAIGQWIGGDTEGTLIGTGVGAAVGYAIGNESDKSRQADWHRANYEY